MRNREQWKPNRVIWNEKRNRYEANKSVVYGGSYYIAERQLEAYVPLIQEHCHGDLLDCGCGSFPYLALYEEGCKTVTGVDWEETHGANPFPDKIADLNVGIPFEDSSFDTILVTDVIAHIYKPHELFNEFERVLRPGGKVLVMTPFLYWISEPPYEFFRYTEFALRRMSLDAGLEVESLTAYGGQLASELDMLNKRMASKWGYRFFRLKRLWWEAMRKEVNSDKFPLGYCLVSRKPADT